MTRGRSVWSRVSFFVAFLVLVGLAPPVALSVDLIAFSNGDKCYGEVIGYRVGKRMVAVGSGGIFRDLIGAMGHQAGQLIVDLDGKQLAFSPGAVAQVTKSVPAPPDADLLKPRLEPPPGVPLLVQRATGVDVDVSVRPVGDDRQLTVVTERGFSAPVVRLGVLLTSFFGRRGCSVGGIMRNDSESLVDAGFDHVRIRGYEFVIHAYDAGDVLLASQRFYFSRFPPGRAIPFSVHFPDLPFERIAKIRIARRF